MFAEPTIRSSDTGTSGPRPDTPRARPRSQPAADVATPGPPPARTDALGEILAAAVRQRSSQPVLARAIIAIDGPGDNKLALDSTSACLENLQMKPGRGEVGGPDIVDNIDPPPRIATADETLYILGHGAGLYRADDISGLDPAALGTRLLGWYGTMDYHGKIKLVSCKSAREDHTVRGDASYAELLSRWLNAHATTTFKPRSVDGVVGIAWAGEDTGKIQSIDLFKYRALQDVEKGAFGLPDADERKEEIDALLGEVGGPGSGAIRQTGKSTRGGGKVRFTTNYAPPTPTVVAMPPMHNAVVAPPTKTERVVRFFRRVGSALKPSWL